MQFASEDAVAVADLGSPLCAPGAGQGTVDDGDVTLEAATSQGALSVRGGEGEVSGWIEEENVTRSGEVLAARTQTAMREALLARHKWVIAKAVGPLASR
ncbi:hypothetical protein SF23_00225 [Streptomyces sp. MBRL 10]|nr:hypothetical protein SF23_00225 [Streptomyces sp. MBRL 10]